MVLQEIGWEDVDWMHLAQDRDQRWEGWLVCWLVGWLIG